MTGIDIINEEQQRQRDMGYTLEHDLGYITECLPLAASCYASPAKHRSLDNSFVGVPLIWPFESESWKPTPENRIKELAKAGALIASEIDRLLNYKNNENNEQKTN